MPVSFQLTIYPEVLNQAALRRAVATVTETTRQVYNRATILTPVDTGNLRAQNKWKVHVNAHGAVGTVFNETEYAAAVHDGTRAYTIRPRRAKALRFKVDGEVVFAKSVRIKAKRGRPWIYRAMIEIALPRGFKQV